VIVSVPDLLPLVVGSKKIPIEQLEPAARVLPHAFSTPKSEGLVFTFVMLSTAVPEFVTVRVCGRPLVPTYWDEKVKLDADKIAVGAGGVLPVKVTK